MKIIPKCNLFFLFRGEKTCFLEIHLAELSSNLSLLTLMYTCIREHSDGYFIPSML